jgi:hypothetical protein
LHASMRSCLFCVCGSVSISRPLCADLSE